jgi:hypothetical protein
MRHVVDCIFEAAAIRPFLRASKRAMQACAGAPWVIRKEDLEAFEKAQPTQSPQTTNPSQLSIDLQ